MGVCNMLVLLCAFEFSPKHLIGEECKIEIQNIVKIFHSPKPSKDNYLHVVGSLLYVKKNCDPIVVRKF